MKRGQVSLEYLFIIGFSLAVLMPGIFLAYDAFKDHADVIHVKQAEQAGNIILREAEAVYYLGPPSLSKVEIYMPDNVFSVNISRSELVFRVQTQRGIEDVSVISGINVTGSLSPKQGIHEVTVQAVGGKVVISE